MARLVLISIPDNADAEAFINAMKTGHIFYGTPVVGYVAGELAYHSLDVAADVEASWADPTKMCECHPAYKLPNPIGKGDKGLVCQSVQSKTYKWRLALRSRPRGHPGTSVRSHRMGACH